MPFATGFNQMIRFFETYPCHVISRISHSYKKSDRDIDDDNQYQLN